MALSELGLRHCRPVLYTALRKKQYAITGRFRDEHPSAQLWQKSIKSIGLDYQGSHHRRANPVIPVRFPHNILRHQATSSSMKRSTYPFSLSALLLASSVIAVPLDLSADAEKLTPRAPPVCTTDRTLIDPLCWDTLKIGDYLTSWGKTTPKCADTGRTGVKCCTSTESWSTCFLRLATGSPGYKCDDMSPAFCGNTPQLSAEIGPDIRPQVSYIVRGIFSIHQFFASYDRGK